MGVWSLLRSHADVLGALALVCVLVVSVLPGMVEAHQGVPSSRESAMDLRLSYTFPEPTIEDTGNGNSVTIEGLATTGNEGEPMLPSRAARVLLPPGTEFSGFD
ncbi:MAG: hypothetical protein LUQ55_02120, partial [Methanomassiliicoccales archaeon]|nr:hypothetical protein [Methanomassiliicoccales archaeon]